MNPESGFSRRYGPRAIVCGASEGLGAAFARDIAGRGLDLILVARRRKLLEELARSLTRRHSISVETVVADLAGRDSLQTLSDLIAQQEVGLLVYNAALSHIGPFLGRAAPEHVTELDINVRGPMVLAHAAATAMRARNRGGIVLMSSLSGFQGTPLIANYAATRAYNTVLAQGLYEEFRGGGIDLVASCAGAIATPNYEASRPQKRPPFTPAPLSPEYVARITLDALGRRSLVIPGRANRTAAFIMNRLLPRRLAVRLIARNTQTMYG